MPKLWYASTRFSPKSRETIAQANVIIADYEAQGFTLTLRQCFYQFVSRGLIPNTDREYKRLGSIINDARMAGLIDWDAIEDRTRFLRSLSHWDDPASIMDGAARSYRVDKWATQPYAVEVWIENDALVGVIEGVCNRLDVPFFSCRGYTSASEMWRASQRLGEKIADGKIVKVLHLGDHDPSGIDMSRDIEDRLYHFMLVDFAREELGGSDADEDSAAAVQQSREMLADQFSLDRLALNFDQVEAYNPPPNPAKVTDSRAAGYIERHGRQSWELDALDPPVIAQLIEDAVLEVRDEDQWDSARAREEEERLLLTQASRRWDEVKAFLIDVDEDD